MLVVHKFLLIVLYIDYAVFTIQKSNVWTGPAEGNFEDFELNYAKACVLCELKEELVADGEKVVFTEMPGV